jgi:hypothetical protein
LDNGTLQCAGRAHERAGASDLLSLLLVIMAHQSSPVAAHPTSRPSIVDLLSVVVLAALLWVTAQGVGAVTRASTLHGHGAAAPGAADCATPPTHTVAQASPLSPAIGECAPGDAAKTGR